MRQQAKKGLPSYAVLTLYARKEPTLDQLAKDIFPAQQKQDVALYYDAEGSRLAGYYGWDKTSKPRANSTKVMLNCYQYKLEWMKACEPTEQMALTLFELAQGNSYRYKQEQILEAKKAVSSALGIPYLPDSQRICLRKWMMELTYPGYLGHGADYENQKAALMAVSADIQKIATAPARDVTESVSTSLHQEMAP